MPEEQWLCSENNASLRICAAQECGLHTTKKLDMSKISQEKSTNDEETCLSSLFLTRGEASKEGLFSFIQESLCGAHPVGRSPRVTLPIPHGFGATRNFRVNNASGTSKSQDRPTFRAVCMRCIASYPAIQILVFYGRAVRISAAFVFCTSS